MSGDKVWTTIPVTKEAVKLIDQHKPEGQAYHIYIRNLIQEVEE